MKVDGCGCVSNAQVYGIEESIRRAKFPMSVDTEKIISANELEFWLQDAFLPSFVEYMDSGKYPKFVLEDGYVRMLVNVKSGYEKEVLIDEEDVPAIYKYDWHFDRYCRSNEVGYLHRFIMQDYLRGNESMVVDHINGDAADNRKANLRLATMSNNSYNAVVRKNNKSGVMGVCWKAGKNKWKAYINNYGKQIHIGYYDAFEDAVKARLQKEKEMCGGFAPQRNLFSDYGIEPECTTGATKTFCRLKDAIAAYRNIMRLSRSGLGEGHDQALTGVVVQFDLTFSNKAWVEIERYHFVDFVSSQSTMHRIAKFELSKAYNEYVDPRIIEIMKEKVAEYNSLLEVYPEDVRKQRYLEILYSNPAGFKLTAGITTNYRQLKTIYWQRRNHRLPEWREFCKWVETLPLMDVILK